MKQMKKTCPKHVEFYSKNKFEELVHLIGFIIRIYHDARYSECQIRRWSRMYVKSKTLCLTWFSFTNWTAFLLYQFHSLLCCCEQNKHADKTVLQRGKVLVSRIMWEKEVTQKRIDSDEKQQQSQHVQNRRHWLEDLSYETSHTSAMTRVHQKNGA